ncbi:MAG TPA: hypothetical protein VGO50_14950 [Pyrinomonadaceae bacterium]|jgi:hypothetical protein|nr:hypothetical protein [Pyrinomonadaceae bacterium]
MKSAKRSALSLSRFFAIAAAIFALSLPALAYEEDTHFQMTYVICRSVGFTHDEALIVAAADQGMDDSPGLVANGGPGGVIPNVDEEALWHALDGYGYTQGGTMKVSGLLQRRDQFFQAALNEPGYYNKLVRLGVFFHYQQDTWGHRHHYKDLIVRLSTDYDPNHLSPDNYVTYNTPTGHAPDGHAPDRPPFDPVAAVYNLENGIVYARTFLKQALGREPGTFLANYTPQGGQDDGNWSSGKKGAYFHQIDLSGVAQNSARAYVLNLIRAQIDIYTTSMTPNPRLTPRYTPDEANLDLNRAALNKVAKDFEPYRSAGIVNPTISIPTTADKVAAGFTNLTTPYYSAQFLPLTSVITDGMRIRQASNGAIYLVIDGKFRWIPDQATYNNLYSSGSVVNVPTVAQYPGGSQLSSGAYLANVPGQPEIYLVVDGAKRWINSLQALGRYGFSGPVRQLTAGQMGAIPTGAPIGNPAYSFIGTDGSRVSTPDGTIYLIINQQLRWIPNIATYNNLFSGGGGPNVPTVAGYLLGPALTDGAYLAKAAPDPKVYLIVDGKKRWITSPAAMTSFGFDWNKIKSVSAAQLAAIPDGLNIP